MPTDVSAMRREHLEAFIGDQLARWKPTTAANRYSGIRPFFAWLVDEGEIKVNPMAKMRKPKLPEHAPPIPSDTDVERLLTASSGQDIVERRDTAILRTFLATGARLSEVAGLRYTPRNPATNDVDLDLGIIRIISGKGRRERISYLSAKAVKALDRYLRVRARHGRAAEPWLWLGEKGRLTDSGIVQMLKRRTREAGVTGIHAHSFRHWYASEALRSGMQEGEVMALAGWSSREMLSRYGKAAETSSQRPAAHIVASTAACSSGMSSWRRPISRHKPISRRRRSASASL